MELSSLIESLTLIEDEPRAEPGDAKRFLCAKELGGHQEHPSANTQALWQAHGHGDNRSKRAGEAGRIDWFVL